MCSTKAERTYLSLKRIKTYLRNTMGQSRLNSLSVISIGRDLIKNCTIFKKEVRKNLLIYKWLCCNIFVVKKKQVVLKRPSTIVQIT